MMIKIIRGFLRKLVNKKKEPKVIGFFTKEDGLIHAKYEDGSFSEMGLRAMSEKSVRKLQLIGDGYTEEEAIGIIKSEERDKKINEILKD
jgi:predicted CopG family antitoxin